jgi:hypothetical protein
MAYAGSARQLMKIPQCVGEQRQAGDAFLRVFAGQSSTERVYRQGEATRSRVADQPLDFGRVASAEPPERSSAS